MSWLITVETYDDAIIQREERYTLTVTDPIAIAPATSWGFWGRASAWIESQWVGDYVLGSSVGPWIHLAPSQYTLRWQRAEQSGGDVGWLIRSSPLPRDGRLAVVGWACYPQPLQRLWRFFLSAMTHGVYVHVWAWGEPYMTHTRRKLIGLRRRMRWLPSSYGYVMQVDIGDSLLLASEGEILERLKNLDKPLMGCEGLCSPVCAPEWQRFTGKGSHPYPNAGFLVGPRGALFDAVNRVIAMRDEYNAHGYPQWAGSPRPWNDQYLWHVAILGGVVELVLDTEWEIVANLTREFANPATTKGVVLSGRTMLTPRGGRPIAVHFPGAGKRFMHLWDGLFSLPWGVCLPDLSR